MCEMFFIAGVRKHSKKIGAYGIAAEAGEGAAAADETATMPRVTVRELLLQRNVRSHAIAFLQQLAAECRKECGGRPR